MEFDDQMRRFFGTDDLGAVSPAALASGVERMQVEFGLETDKGRKFAIWSLLYMLGSAPDLDVAFKDERDREDEREREDAHGPRFLSTSARMGRSKRAPPGPQWRSNRSRTRSSVAARGRRSLCVTLTMRRSKSA